MNIARWMSDLNPEWYLDIAWYESSYTSQCRVRSSIR